MEIDTATREALEQIGRDLAGAEFAVVFTGAGISTESGLPDYRGADGLWKNKRFEELANIETFKSDPVEFWQFYAERLRSLRDAKPNAAHRALAHLLKTGIVKAVITQNVDGLHLAAGEADGVVELHGSLSRGECLECGATYALEIIEARIEASDDGVPRCDCGYPIKPGVVLFGEYLPQSEQWSAKRLTREADYILCLGSSLKVRPASSLPETVLLGDGKVGIVNIGTTSYDGRPGVTKVEAPLGQAMQIIAADAERGTTDVLIMPSPNEGEEFAAFGLTYRGSGWLLRNDDGASMVQGYSIPANLVYESYPETLAAKASAAGLQVQEFAAFTSEALPLEASMPLAWASDDTQDEREALTKAKRSADILRRET